MESGARKYAEWQFGESYSKSLLARSIQDLVYVFPEDSEVMKTGLYAGETILRRVELASEVVKAIVEQQVPRRLLQCAGVKLEETGWFTDGGHLDATALGKYIGESRDTALQLSLKRLRDCVALDADGQAQELMRCERAGMMCLTAAAHPNLYLTEDNKEFVLPPEKLKFDLRGRVDVSGNGHSVYIDVGEVKLALAYREAVKQLGLRLGALKWFVTTCVPSSDPDVRLVGRLVVSEAGLGRGDRDVINFEQRTMAFDKWGYSLYLHTF